MVETTQSQTLPSEALKLPKVLDGLHSRRAFNKWMLTGLFLGSLPNARADDMSDTECLSPIVAGKGSLLIAGGGRLPEEVHKLFVEQAGGKNARVVVIPTGSDLANDDPKQNLSSFWEWEEHVASAKKLHTRRMDRANDPEFVRALQEATAVWMSGGDQSDLATPYRGTLVEQELHKLLRRGGIIGGTSAGAAAMSPRMIAGGKDVARMGDGLRLAPPNCFIDQHLDTRGRLARLLGVVESHPGSVGIGIDEQTAFHFQGTRGTAVGKGTVRICRPDKEPLVVLAGQSVELSTFEIFVAKAGAR